VLFGTTVFGSELRGRFGVRIEKRRENHVRVCLVYVHSCIHVFIVAEFCRFEL